MLCPFCNHLGTRVLDSRPSHEGRTIKRRRECEECERRFTTFESVHIQQLIVIKKDGSRQEFNRDKILRGLIKACEKCSVPFAKIEQLVSEVEKELRELAITETPSKEIGELVMSKLINIDEIAYVRFASVYRKFKDASFLLNELENLLNKSKN